MSHQLDISTFRYPTWIKFGVGAIQLVPSLCKGAQIKRPLLITDKNLKDHSMITQLVSALTQQNFAVQVFAGAYGL